MDRSGMSTSRLAASAACIAIAFIAGCAPAASPPAPTVAPVPPTAAPKPTTSAAAPTVAPTTVPATVPTAVPKPTTPPQPTAVPKPTAAPTAAVAPTKISVSYPEGGAHLPLFLARDKGIFAKYGLDVTLQGLGGGPAAMAALIGGDIQIADITGSEVVNANANGSDLLILATLDPVYPYVFEVSPEIKSKEDLIGKSIAIRAAGDATDIATRVALKNAGLDPDNDVTILALTQENARMAALTTGQMCCSVAQVQDRLTLEKQGFHVLFDLTAEGLPNAQGVITTQRAYATAHPEVVQGFINAIVEGIAGMKADKAAALPVLKAQLSLEDDTIVGATYDFFAKSVVPSVPLPAPAQFADGISILSAKNEKVKGFDVAKYIDASYVQKAVSLGLDKTP